MLDAFCCTNHVDTNGNPVGGQVSGIGLNINWQNRPLGRGFNRAQPSGAFIETVIAAVVQRIDFYQTANNRKFSCTENEHALALLNAALFILNQRTRAREARQVEGTHTA